MAGRAVRAGAGRIAWPGTRPRWPTGASGLRSLGRVYVRTWPGYQDLSNHIGTDNQLSVPGLTCIRIGHSLSPT